MRFITSTSSHNNKIQWQSQDSKKTSMRKHKNVNSNTKPRLNDTWLLWSGKTNNYHLHHTINIQSNLYIKGSRGTTSYAFYIKVHFGCIVHKRDIFDVPFIGSDLLYTGAL